MIGKSYSGFSSIAGVIAAVYLLAPCLRAQSDLIASTNFDGRTLSPSNTAGGLNWTTSGVEDPGIMAAFTWGGAAQPLFDGNSLTQNMFAPALNVGNALNDETRSWTTAVKLTVLPGFSVSVASVAFDYWAVSGGQAQQGVGVPRNSDFVATLFSPAMIELATVSQIDVVNGNGSGVGTPVLLTFPAPIALIDPGAYTLRIRAGDIDNNETGNHTAIDNLSVLGTVAGGAGMRITSFTGLGGDLWEVTVQGSPHTVVEFRSSPELDFNPGLLLENLVQGDTADPGAVGGPNNSMLVTDETGLGVVRVTLTGERNFLRAQAPRAPLSETFDASAALPAGWTTNGTVNGTAWQIGLPSGVSSGPSAAHSAPHCAGTNIGGYYTGETDVSLFSPVLSIPPGIGAKLSFWQHIDTDLSGDFAAVRILDADNADAPIPGVGIEEIAGDGSAGWTAVTLALTPAQVGGKNIKVEFRFTSNPGNTPDLDVWSGFYIDDVNVALVRP